MRDIYMTNMTAYRLLGRPATPVQDDPECPDADNSFDNDITLIGENQDLFTKKCLLQLHALELSEVADEVQSY